jgi:hypothetical protein
MSEDPARFDARRVEKEQGQVCEAPVTKRTGNRYAKSKTSAPHLDSTQGSLAVGQAYF